MADQTSTEMEKENIAKMGDALGKQYSALWQEIAILFVNWAEYVELFGTKPERLELMNRAAPMFFRRVQDELWETTVMHLARLTDPPKSMGKANLTVKNLPDVITDAKLKERVNELIKEADALVEFCRDWRNRHIAHTDLALALKEPAAPLKDGSRKQVKEALGALAKVINVVASHYKDGETRFDLTPRHNGSVSLLYVIDAGIRANDEQAKRFDSGKATEDDFKARDI